MFSFHHFDLLNSTVFFSSLVFLCFLGKILNKILFISGAFIFLLRVTRCFSWKEWTILETKKGNSLIVFCDNMRDSLRTCLCHLRYFVVYRLHAASNIHTSSVRSFIFYFIIEWEFEKNKTKLKLIFKAVFLSFNRVCFSLEGVSIKMWRFV